MQSTEINPQAQNDACKSFGKSHLEPSVNNLIIEEQGVVCWQKICICFILNLATQLKYWQQHLIMCICVMWWQDIIQNVMQNGVFMYFLNNAMQMVSSCIPLLICTPVMSTLTGCFSCMHVLKTSVIHFLSFDDGLCYCADQVTSSNCSNIQNGCGKCQGFQICHPVLLLWFEHVLSNLKYPPCHALRIFPTD